MTLYYRSPELVFGENKYSIGIDLWALGCVFAEVITGEALFKAKCELELLFKFTQVLGPISIETCPCIKDFQDKKGPMFKLPKSVDGPKLTDILNGFDPKGIDLIQKLLHYDPNQRLCAKEALEHPFFKTGTPAKK